MKKIIWIFGESATGKKTLIEYLMNNPNSEFAIQLGLENEKISVVERTISNNLSSFDDMNNEKVRYAQIIECIKNFMYEENNSILLIKGQSNDMDERYGNTLKISALMYPEIEKEILLLDVQDHDILYTRIVNKDWFQANKEKYSEMFPREWLDKSVEKHKNAVYSYESLGYKITEIDSTNGYEIVKKEKSDNYGKSCNSRW